MEAPVLTSIAPDVAWLVAPVERVTGADIPMPYAANLEVDAIPVAQNVINAVQKVCYRSA